MNRTVRNRDKRIAMLLTLAFAWLFIGSLIIFHQEHVLGKHIELNSHLFISPKSKDKQGISLKLILPAQKFYDNESPDGIWAKSCLSAVNRIASKIKPEESSSLYIDDFVLCYSLLRAPPTV